MTTITKITGIKAYKEKFRAVKSNLKICTTPKRKFVEVKRSGGRQETKRLDALNELITVKVRLFL